MFRRRGASAAVRHAGEASVDAPRRYAFIQDRVGREPNDMKHKALIGDHRLIEFPRIVDPDGSLTFIEEARHVPFSIRRVFYVYDVRTGGRRGAHAHKTLEQVIVCLAGGLTVSLDDAYNKASHELSRPEIGLYVPPMTWMSVGNFAPGTVYMVLASDFYNESDYYRDYGEFLGAVRGDG
jgi:hypothetical protein